MSFHNKMSSLVILLTFRCLVGNWENAQAILELFLDQADWSRLMLCCLCVCGVWLHLVNARRCENFIEATAFYTMASYYAIPHQALYAHVSAVSDFNFNAGM